MILSYTSPTLLMILVLALTLSLWTAGTQTCLGEGSSWHRQPSAHLWGMPHAQREEAGDRSGKWWRGEMSCPGKFLRHQLVGATGCTRVNWISHYYSCILTPEMLSGSCFHEKTIIAPFLPTSSSPSLFNRLYNRAHVTPSAQRFSLWRITFFNPFRR